MAWSTRRAGTAVLLALGVEGCFTGHLLDAARRCEQPIAFQDAFVDDDRLVLRYTALVADDLGEPLGHEDRAASIALADLRRSDVPPVESFPVERLPGDTPRRGERVTLHEAGSGASVAPPYLDIDGADGRLVLHDAHDGALAPFYAAALARTRTALWAYPLVPFALVIDAATNPVLLFFAPAVIVLGD